MYESSMLKNSFIPLLILLFLQGCQTLEAPDRFLSGQNIDRVELQDEARNPPIPSRKSEAQDTDQKTKAEKARLEEQLSLGQSLRYLIPAKCEGPLLAKGGETIQLFTQLKRQSERFLRASGTLDVKGVSCDIERMWLSFELQINADFKLGNLGRRVASDKANFLFPYAIAIVSGRDEIVAQYANVLLAEFPPEQHQSVVSETVKQELLLSDLGLHGPYTIYAAFVQPTDREYFNDSDHPAIWMLARKPDLSQ